MRHELEAKEPEQHICFVGFDRGLETFYVYVANRGKTGKLGAVERVNHVVKWVGTTEREITSVDEVKALVTPYAELPEGVERDLRSCVEGVKAIEHRQGA